MIVFIGIVAVLLFPGQAASDVMNNGGKFNVDCDVTIRNPLGNSRIEAISCTREDSCFFQFQLPGLGFFSDSGRLRMEADDGSTALEDWTVPEQGVRTIEITTCTESSSGEMTLLDETNQQIDKKVWSVR